MLSPFVVSSNLLSSSEVFSVLSFCRVVSCRVLSRHRCGALSLSLSLSLPLSLSLSLSLTVFCAHAAFCPPSPVPHVRTLVLLVLSLLVLSPFSRVYGSVLEGNRFIAGGVVEAKGEGDEGVDVDVCVHWGNEQMRPASAKQVRRRLHGGNFVVSV